MIRLTLAVLSAVALSAGAAYAQSDPANPDPSAAVNPPMTEPSAPIGVPVNAAATERTTADGRPIMLLPSPTPADQAYRLKAGDATVVANPPVPDTLENRAKYGGPVSNGGRKTKPRGN